MIFNGPVTKFIFYNLQDSENRPSGRFSPFVKRKQFSKMSLQF